jgi:hypothetical protein
MRNLKHIRSWHRHGRRHSSVRIKQGREPQGESIRKFSLLQLRSARPLGVQVPQADDGAAVTAAHAYRGRRQRRSTRARGAPAPKHVAFTQGKVLPNNRAYLDGCLMVTAFKSKKYLEGIRTLKNEIKINCNEGAVMTNQMGSYGRMNVWYIPKGIANIFSMHELEKMYHITYDSLDGYYVMHTPRGKWCSTRTNKDYPIST